MKTLLNMSTSTGVWLSNELATVSFVISEHLKNKHDAVNDVCGELAVYKGKLLRPSMLLLSWKTVAGNSPPPTHLSVAAAVVELIHLATLVHDDVLDEADVRRGKQTINNLWGNEAAVMLGDYLLSSAFHLCSTIHNPSLNLLLGEVTNTVCAGELVQLYHRNNIGLDLDSYYQIVHDKTASLIGASCEIGAMLGGGCKDDSLVLKNYGKSIGTAFQIKDDLLDLLGDQKNIGKPAGRDVEKGKLTLPVILMLEKDPGLRPKITEVIIENDRPTLIQMLDSSGSIQEAFGVVNKLVNSATQSLKNTFKNDTATQLCALAEQLKQAI